MRKDGDAPLVSVVVATYNWSSVLRYALLSAQNQTFRNLEVLVIGDGCTDDSGDVVESIGDSRFRWENLAANSGHQSAPNNRGAALARGEWIAYLGHDDLWMPNHLELLLQKLKETDADVAFSLAMAIGAPDCGGRALFGLFDNGQYERGCDLPPSTLIHRRSLVGSWPDHRTSRGSPESALLAGFYDQGAKFTFRADVTVFKFPSSWRPLSYVKQTCDEQAEFFRRMQHEPDFFRRELTEFAMATQLFKPHTKIAAAAAEDNLQPGGVIEGFRRNRGLTLEVPEEGAPRYIPTPALGRMIAQLAHEEIQRRQESRFAIFEVFYAQQGRYHAGNSKRTLIQIGKWARIRIPLESGSDGAPLRIDPCERPAVIEVAWIALRRDGRVTWCARGQALNTLNVTGDAFVMKLGRVLTIRSRGNDPILFLPGEICAEPGMVFDCWMRITNQQSTVAEVVTNEK